MATEPKSGADRRKHPRFRKTLTLETGADNGFPALETLNVSLGGCLCRVDHYIEPMTKFRVSGSIPGLNLPFEADAVVVRIDPDKEASEQDDYRVALFFQRMEDASRSALQSYLAG